MSSTSFPLGSQWRKWDLHVHTPLSIVESYGGDTPEIWARFLTDLEALPPEFKVLGINDYLFIDGYEKLLANKNEGRLKNIELILPVLEFRLSDFAGVDFGKYLRPNLHVIFSNDISPSIIRSQFLATLDSKYKLEKDGIDFHRTIDRASLSDLGTSLINSVPDSQKSKFKSPIVEGFNNLNLSLPQIQDSLSKDCFFEKYLLAIGKTEWEAIKWSDASIASKKNLINSCDIVFTSAESVETFNKAKLKLKEQNVKDLLLDCSDAHIFSERENKKNANLKDRIGKCFTWIKADPTFEGLKQITYEPENRVYVGDTPPVFSRISQNSTRYIESIHITQKSGYNSENGVWFKDIKIPLNHELVAIIGNKGNGKSAISDIIGLLGNTHNSGGPENPDFSFLRKKKFIERGYAENFLAKISWLDGTTEEKHLDEQIDTTQLEKVRYLPQNFFETITNELAGANFEAAIKNVIFSHIPVANRFGKATFAELADYKASTINKAIEQSKQKINTLSTQIIDLERRKHPKHLKELESKLKERRKEQTAQNKLKPKAVASPHVDKQQSKTITAQAKRLKELNQQLEQTEAQIIVQKSKEEELTLSIEELTQFLEELNQTKDHVEGFIEANQSKLRKYKLDIRKILKFKITPEIVLREVTAMQVALQQVEHLINETKSLASSDVSPEQLKQIKGKNLILKKKRIQDQIDKLTKALSKPAREYQQYQAKLKKWKSDGEEIRGDLTKPGSLKYLEAEAIFIQKKLDAELKQKRTERISESVKIFRKKREIIDLYDTFKKSIDAEINKDRAFTDKFTMQISVSFKLDGNFNDDFLHYINKAIAGSFKGSNEGGKFLTGLTENKDFLREDHVENFLTEIIQYLEIDQREKNKAEDSNRYISDQISKLPDFYHFLFSLDYLIPLYELKLDNKNISQLSPGEKGALLLVFYLMIDKDDIPLIIDQPEDNLDNQSVYNVLTHFIRAAKLRRQIIIVTHNPNLAVGADAEQIIYTSIDKERKNRFDVLSGAIENKAINQKIVDILEGTMPAFDRRRLKYQRVLNS